MMKEAPLSGKRILIVDDDYLTLEWFSIYLKSQGADVQQANQVSSAMEICQSWIPDVIVSDIAMPGEDGFELLNRLKSLEQMKKIPVIAVSGYPKSEVYNGKYDAYINKPVEPAHLLKTILSTCGSKTS